MVKCGSHRTNNIEGIASSNSSYVQLLGFRSSRLDWDVSVQFDAPRYVCSCLSESSVSIWILQFINRNDLNHGLCSVVRASCESGVKVGSIR